MKKTFFAFITLLICVLSASAIESRRYQINGTYYEFFKFDSDSNINTYYVALSEVDALTPIEIDGNKYTAQLATFNSEQDMELLAQADADNNDENQWSINWIGLTCDIDDHKKITNAKWVDGEKFIEADYAPGKIEGSGSCAAGIYGIGNSSWNDTFLNFQSVNEHPFGGYVVEYVAVPEPSTYAAILGVLSLGFIALRRRK